MLSHFHQIIILGKTTTLLLILICTGCFFLNIQFLEAANSGMGGQYTKEAIVTGSKIPLLVAATCYMDFASS